MKAAIFYEPDKPLKIEDVPIPDITEDEILVKVSACGICHTDLHHIDHNVPTVKKPPIILGHEPSGIVEKVGSRVKGFKDKDRVVLPAGYPCGDCFFCRTGRGNACSSMKNFGNEVDGAYAEYVKIPAKEAFLLPEEIPLIEGCLLADAVVTSYHCVKNRAEVKPGDSVVVIGCGGVGLNVIQIANLAGGIVIGVDILENKLQIAKEFGASEIINAKETPDVPRTVRKLTGGGADIAIEAIGNPLTMEQAFACIRTGGRFVILGYTNKNMNLNAGRTMYRELEVKGTMGCSTVEFPRVIELVKRGRIKIKPLVTHRFPLDEINMALDVMRRGEGIRTVVIP